MTGVPHPPDETADELRAALRRNHPELSDEQIDALLTGEPNRGRPRGPKPRFDNLGKREPWITAGRRQRGGWRGRKGVQS